MNYKLASLVVVFALTGCTYFYDGKPLAAKYDPQNEYKLKSIAHWGIVADDVSTQVADALRPKIQTTSLQGDDVRYVPPAYDQPVYVSVASNTKFAKVFASQLQSALLNKGFQVKTNPSGALRLNFKVDVVTHSQLNPLEIDSSKAVFLPDSVVVVRGSRNSPASDLANGSTLGLWDEIHKRPNSEVAVTTTGVIGESYLIHRTDTYYIDTADSNLYKGMYSDSSDESQGSNASKGKVVPVTGGKGQQ